MNHTTRLPAVLYIALVAATVVDARDVSAEHPAFPPLGSAQSVRGELVSADFIHRTGKFRTAAGELIDFTMPPYSIVTYRGTESDLREVPLGTELEFLLLPDEDGRLTQLVGTKHGQSFDKDQRQRFIDFTTARGIAGWIDQTADKLVTVTFFSGTPDRFAETWDGAFAVGADVTVCVANDELRTWQPTSCGEKGKIVESHNAPVGGYGSSGRRVVIQVNHMLEGFRQGRIVRVFGSGWKVRNQLYQECLINYGYSHRPPPDFRECLAKHYPETFPYRTDFSNRHLPWFQVQDGSPPPMHSEHLMLGDLIALDPATQSGEFKTERKGEIVKFTMFGTSARNSAIRYLSDSFEGSRSRLSELPLGQRYRFTMYQDARGEFTRCSSISDEYSYTSLNTFFYKIRALDLARGCIEVEWQAVPVLNYQKDQETPPPYGHNFFQLVPESRIWKDGTALTPAALKAGDSLRVNVTSEYPGRPAHCADVWVVDNPGTRTKPKK